MTRTVRPNRLRPGDRVVVVSPSGSIVDETDLVERSRRSLEASLDIKVELSPNALGRSFYSSGTSAERRSDLMSAFVDPTVSGVFFSIGGATAIDLVDRLDYDRIAQKPKVVAGISDSSTLLNAITARTGLVTFHGFELLDFGRHEMLYTTDWMGKVLFDGWSGEYSPNPGWRDLAGEVSSYRGRRAIKLGCASGTAVGGNSEAFLQIVDTDYCPPLDGSILVLETYRLQKRHIHATLAHLKLRGVFERVAGLVLGYCLGSDVPGPGNHRDIADLASDVLADYDLPVIQIGEIGHQVENLILPLGANVEIDSNGPSLTLTEPAVAPARN